MFSSMTVPVCVDCIERQLSPKKNRVGGPGAKGAGGPKPDLSQVGQSPAVHCSEFQSSALSSTSSLLRLVAPRTVPSGLAQTNDTPP